MEFLDDQGRLFGLVNVVDALVILVVASIVVAGVAVLVPSGDRETRYVTLALGEQPSYVASQITAGDSMPAGPQGGNVTVTDVYTTPSGDNASVVVRARLSGRLQSGDAGGPQFTYGGQPVRSGRQLTVSTPEYTVSGVVTNATAAGTELPTARTAVVLEGVVGPATAESIRAGDRARAGGRTVSEVQSVQSYPMDNESPRVVVGLSLRTLSSDGTPTFGGQPVRVGARLTFRSDGYAVGGHVATIGSTAVLANTTTTTAVVEVRNVPPGTADDVTAGLTERSRGRVLARVTDVRSEPSTVILRSESGEIFAREHPRNRDLFLTTSLTTRRTAQGLRFHARPLRIGSTVVFDFGRTTVQGTVTRLRDG
ncbi:MAG: DUF4330 domain-containing protein [Halorientalis sp.]